MNEVSRILILFAYRVSSSKYNTYLSYHPLFLGLCQIHRHVGSLYQIVGRYADCLSHYKDYLAMAKCSADKLEIAQAYGHLGSLYGNIGEICDQYWLNNIKIMAIND